MAMTDTPSAALNSRRARILRDIEECGFVTIDALAASLGVSAQTVRRDIIALDGLGFVQRFHGGAGRNGALRAENSATVRLGHGAKRDVAVKAKRRAARAAAAAIPDGAYIYIDVGTTMEELAAVLAERTGLTVFTNSLRVASGLGSAAHDVHVLGGQLWGNDGSLVGATAVERIASLRLDAAFIACSAVEADGSVMDFDPHKIAIKRAALRSARTRYLLATPEKFGRSARERLAVLADFDAVFRGDGGADG
ncbi:MAG: DeoR/GlpR family DNA-binding transcription regulator [Pseudomonadota bacterium]